jgi:hypothetical protein
MFCGECGTELIDGVCPKCTPKETKPEKIYGDKLKNFFVSSDERLVAVLGDTYIDNFLRIGSIKNGFAFASDKRVYFQGTQYYTYANGKKKVCNNQQFRTIDLKDVTGTGPDSYCNLFLKIFSKIGGIVFGILLIAAIIFKRELHLNDYPTIFLLVFLLLILGLCLCIYIDKTCKVSLVTVQYSGGAIGFNVNWFTPQEIELFQKEIGLAKDRAVEISDNTVADRLQETVNNITQSASSANSKADEISKLVDLLQKGVITQEEFEKMKKELI